MTKRVLTGMSLLLATTLAHAHAHLAASTPADKSHVAAPAAVELKFSEAVRVTALTLQQGKNAAKPLAPLPTKAATTASVPLPKLDAGDYVVAWRAASDDGHIVSGSIAFNVDPGAPAAAGKTGDGSSQKQH
jgi:hypothetical protein